MLAHFLLKVNMFSKKSYNFNEVIQMNIGDKILRAREMAELSQQKVADLIPMNQSSYSKIERGIQEPSMIQLKRICEILKIDPRYLLNLERVNDEQLCNAFRKAEPNIQKGIKSILNI